TKAHSLFKESLAIRREVGDRQGTAESLSHLASVAICQGGHTAARALYEESLGIARQVGNKLTIASCLAGLAGVVTAQGESVWAGRLWGAAEALREAIGAPIPPVERANYEHAVADAR